MPISQSSHPRGPVVGKGALTMDAVLGPRAILGWGVADLIDLERVLYSLAPGLLGLGV
jgi:hypothetical protein